MAWLSVTPEGNDLSRGEMYDYELPDISGGEYIVQHLESLGFYAESGMGARGVTYQEINAWQTQTNKHLSPWDVETIFAASRHFADQIIKAQDKDCPPPLEIKPTAEQTERIMNFFESRVQK